MRDLLVMQGVWFAGAAIVEAPTPTLTSTLLLMRVGYSILIGLSYGITKWFHTSLHTG